MRRRFCASFWHRSGWAVLAALAGTSCRQPATSVRSALADRPAAGSPSASRRPAAPIAADATPDTSGSSWSPAAKLPEDVLTLDAARSIAQSANPDVHAAMARLEAAAARIQEAESRYYPSLLFDHTSARTFQTPVTRNRLASLLQPTTAVPLDVAEPQTFVLTALLDAIRRPLFGGASGSSNPFSEHTTSVTASWTLFDGFIREAQVLSTRYVHAATEESRRDVERLVGRSVEAAYFQAQLAEENTRIARAALAFHEEQLTVTQKLLAAGRASQTDVDNFRVLASASQAAVTGAVGARDTARVVLAQLMGLPAGELAPELPLSTLEAERVEEMTVPELSSCVESAMGNRPDLHQLEWLVSASLQDVRAAKGYFSPAVLLSGSWGYDRSANIHYSEDDQSSAGALEVRWELFTGGAREARVRGAAALHMEAVANLNRLRLAIHADVQSALIALRSAQEQIGLQRQTLATAIETRRAVQAAYVAGKEPLTRLNEAQRDVITADANLALARIRLRQAWSDLDAATARGRSADAPAETAPAREP